MVWEPTLRWRLGCSSLRAVLGINICGRGERKGEKGREGQDWAEVTSQVGKLQPVLYVINQPWGAAHPMKAMI